MPCMTLPLWCSISSLWTRLPLLITGLKHMTLSSTSLVTRPHIAREKGQATLDKSLVQLITHGGICADCSFSTVMWLTNHRNVTPPLLAIQIELSTQPYWLIRSEVCLCTAVLTRTPRAGQAKQAASPFPCRRWGLGTRLVQCMAVLGVIDRPVQLKAWFILFILLIAALD